MRPLSPTWLTALFLFLPGCEGKPPEGFRERAPSEEAACFEVVMGLDQAPESACGVADFYVVDPTLGCSEVDVPATHRCLDPLDPIRATTVCFPFASGGASWFDCQYHLLQERLTPTKARRCTDGWLVLAGRHWFDLDACVPEAFGRWLHERGLSVLYGDRSPYDGQPLPEPVGCPEVGEALMLCGGDCGPCPAAFDCIGRSPLHPFGVCAIDGYLAAGNRGAFWFVPPDGPSPALGAEHLVLPLDTCLEAEASLPGGGTCEPL
jgi:hypothetical protein